MQAQLFFVVTSSPSNWSFIKKEARNTMKKAYQSIQLKYHLPPSNFAMIMSQNFLLSRLVIKFCNHSSLTIPRAALSLSFNLNSAFPSRQINKTDYKTSNVSNITWWWFNNTLSQAIRLQGCVNDEKEREKNWLKGLKDFKLQVKHCKQRRYCTTNVWRQWNKDQKVKRGRP